MKKFNLYFTLLLPLGLFPNAYAGPVAVTNETQALQLEQAIDRASEQGNYSHVQELRLELAKHYASTAEFGSAARQYELLLASRPSRHERVGYFVELGKMRYALENYDGAIAAYQDALHDDPKSWDAKLLLARAYARTELDARAIETYQWCLRTKPWARDPHEEIAAVYQRQGFLNKAIKNYQTANSMEARPETYLALSDCYVRQGDVARATDILQQAKAVLPRADYDVRLGEIYRRRGELRKACAAWEEALKSDPHRSDVQLQLAISYDQLNRRSDSDRLFRQLLAAYPDSPLVHFLRAWALYARGDARGSRQEALVVQRLAPTDVVRHYNDKLLEELQKHS